MRTFSLLAVFLLGCPQKPVDTDTSDDTDTDAPHGLDADDDGSEVGDDCDDNDATIYPGAPELCDGLDNDCDEEILDEERDGNGDGEADCQACADAGFFDEIHAASDDELYGVLASITEGVDCTYDSSRRYMFLDIDKHDDEVTCVYTGLNYPNTTYPPNDWDYVNTEHTWPQSNGAENEPAKCDMHHLYPVNADVNSTRGNRPFSKVVSNVHRVSTNDPDDPTGPDTIVTDSYWGKDADGIDVFEPPNFHKGNVARSILYFLVRYGDMMDDSNDAGFQAGPGIHASATRRALFAEWNELDPIDNAEITRSFAIADKQGNANPFVVCPGLVDRFVQAEAP